jgi:L-lactate dehydrogenase
MASKTRIGLVGTGMVGMSYAYSLMQSNLAEELILIDKDEARAAGEAMDLNHGLPFVGPMHIHAGSYADLSGCSLTVVCAGANQRPGQSRLDLLKNNAAVIRDVVPRIVQANPEGVILVATNPVDILTTIAAEFANLPQGKVLGTGTELDTARFRFLLAEYYEVDPRSVHAWIVAEHGDHAVPLWSIANIAGVRLAEFTGPGGRRFQQTVMDQIFERTKNAAQAIIERKKATYYAIGLTLLRVTEAIVRNQRSVLSVTSPLRGQHGIEGIALSLPTVVGLRGAEEVLDLPISGEEVQQLHRAASVLKQHMADIGSR